MDAYLAAAGFGEDRKHPLFHTANRERKLTRAPMTRSDILRMIKRRARDAGLAETTSCHTHRHHQLHRARRQRRESPSHRRPR